jgi:acetolactate synthase I/II/III large subunit
MLLLPLMVRSLGDSKRLERKANHMAQTTGGEMLVRVLEREGVKQIFGLHGGHIDPIFQACAAHGIAIYDTRHEAAAGHMAEGWSRLTGEPGVVVVTAGPGVTNVVTAVADAFVDAVPMVVIGGRHLMRDEDKLLLQDFDGRALMQSITKWSRTVRDPQRLAEYTAMAFREAKAGRPGPVFLEVPMDALTAEVEDETALLPYVADCCCAGPTSEAVERMLSMLAQAKKPLVVAGRGAWFAGAADALREFAEKTSTPVLGNGPIRGAVPEEGHPMGAGSLMTLAILALQPDNAPDLIVLLGARIGMFLGGGSWLPANAKVIQIDVEGAEIGHGRDVDLGIICDSREALRALNRAAEGRTFPDRSQWSATLKGAQNAWKFLYKDALESNALPMHPLRLMREIDTFLGDDDVLAVDGGETFVWMQMAATMNKPGRFISYGYLGCLGVGIPFGLAAKIRYPDKRVLVVTGDGSVGLNFAEFDTAVRHKLPIVVVINNDQAWGMVKHEQELRGLKVVGSELGVVHYEKAAEGFGVYGEMVEDPLQVSAALERAFASGRPACLNVMVDTTPPSPVTEAAVASGGP